MKTISKVFNNALELAFRKAVEDGTKKDKDAIKNAMFKNPPKLKIELPKRERQIQPAPKAGKIPVEKIQAAVDAVSKKDDTIES